MLRGVSFRYSADVSRATVGPRDWQLLSWLRRCSRATDSAGRTRSRCCPMEALRQLRRSFLPTAMTLLLVLGGRSCLRRGSGPVNDRIILILNNLISPDCFKAARCASPAACCVRSLLGGRAVTICSRSRTFPMRPFSASMRSCARWKMIVTRKRLLEWSPSGDPTEGPDKPHRSFGAPCGSVLSCSRHGDHADTFESRRIGRPRLSGALVRLTRYRVVDQPAPCRHEARLTRARSFFSESFPGRPGPSSRPSSARDHWLPPDNCQEYRERGRPSNVAYEHRTRPACNLSAMISAIFPRGS